MRSKKHAKKTRMQLREKLILFKGLIILFLAFISNNINILLSFSL